MKIVLGIPFQEYARQRKIPESSDQYRALERLYDQIHHIQEFIAHSYQFRPIGRETAKMYFEKLQDVGVTPGEKDQLIGNMQEIQSFIDAHIAKAKAKEQELVAQFEGIAAPFESPIHVMRRHDLNR